MEFLPKGAGSADTGEPISRIGVLFAEERSDNL